MDKLNVQLKKVKYYDKLSEETCCFTADLYINGKKVGNVKNDGRGGCTDYNANTVDNHKIIKEAEVYCKTLPKEMLFGNEYEQTIEDLIDEQFDIFLKNKEDMKMKKLFKTSLVFGIPNGYSYSYVNFKKPLSEVPQMILINRINHSLSGEPENTKLLNTNIKFENDKIVFI